VSPPKGGLGPRALQAVADRGVELLLVCGVQLVEEAKGRQLPVLVQFYRLREHQDA
jgi:hypothetical protein